MSKPLCYLTRPAAAALAQVVADLEPRGLTLKVFDCYRPERAVAHFVRWARNLGDVEDEGRVLSAGRQEHAVPRRLYRGALRPFARLDRGPDAWRAAPTAQALDMGTPFDFFSPRSWPSDRSVSAEAQANRALLAQAMRRRGFRPYDKEWWHFTLRHEPYPQTYFDFPVR